jgi:hypothetical protein
LNKWQGFSGETCSQPGKPVLCGRNRQNKTERQNENKQTIDSIWKRFRANLPFARIDSKPQIERRNPCQAEIENETPSLAISCKARIEKGGEAMSALSRLEQIEKRADYLIERLDKANDEKNDLIEVMKTLYDILGGAYSVRNQEKSLELLEETLNRFDED